MSRTLTAKDLFGMMHSMYPGVEDGRDDHDAFEHPLSAVGVVLLSAALLENIDPSFLGALTHYSREFISAITLNMQNNKLWVEGRYDTSDWLSSTGTISPEAESEAQRSPCFGAATLAI
ncbi:MAG: hypothetical protein LAO24_23760 [Acidobacteriia bacterium]|nr:hypothetical protein [Terriglobia bacterium]